MKYRKRPWCKRRSESEVAEMQVCTVTKSESVSHFRKLKNAVKYIT